MTLSEFDRLIEAKKRARVAQDKRKATFDYILADLIGHSLARLRGANGAMPPIEKVYPSLFKDIEDEEELQNKKDEISAIRFKMFAEKYNKKYKGV